ncbi:RimK family alpha-L-glutamate ligase [Candidatus Woesearchaeota archaeon]|nr:MAG: RimK family alpha-L-glutamate ligase [Candidatus Woesearchaeota archaeon]
MKAAIISLGSVSSKWTRDAMKKYFDSVKNLNLKHIEVNLGSGQDPILYKGEPLEKFDCVYAKGSFKYAMLLRAITSFFSDKAYMPIKDNAFLTVHDKIVTHQELQRHGIPMPKTYLSSGIDAAKEILKKINFPVIMKFPQGTQGKGVMYAESYPSASSLLDALETLKQPVLIQEYIESGERDIRALVVGDRVVAAMERKAVKGEKRANIHMGGKGKAINLDVKSRKIAIKTAAAVGAEICGVDLLRSAKGPVVIEANLSPGLQGITEATGIDVADRIAHYLYQKTKEFVEKEQKMNGDRILPDAGIFNSDKEQQIITGLDFRGDRILLPELVTKMTGLKDDDQVEISAKKGFLKIKKFDVKEV